MKENTNKLLQQLKCSFSEQIEDLQTQLSYVLNELFKQSKFSKFLKNLKILWIEEENKKLVEDFQNYIRNTQIIIKQQKLFKWKARSRAAVKEDQKKAKELAQESDAISKSLGIMGRKYFLWHGQENRNSRWENQW